MNVPSQTLYIQNLNEKTKKMEMKRALHLCFASFGRVLDVVCLKTPKLRGQAWVVFADVPSATNALRGMQGSPFYDRPMRIAFARGKSDVVAKADGTWLPPDKRAKGAARPAQGPRARSEEREEDADAAAGAAAAAAAAAAGLPNKILFVEGLPEATTGSMLAMLFQQFPGYKEVRMVEAKPGIAFVEFESELQAGVALSGLGGFKITPTHSMVVTYAKQ